MSRKPLEVRGGIRSQFGDDNLAKFIAHTWFKYNSERQTRIELWKELRNYVFATDTTTTTNKKLPWKNSTTLPKLCQIRDNLHSNYISALFPNDRWLTWEAYSKKDAENNKAKIVQAYMANKCRDNFFREEISQLLYDYIDYGNAFATVDYEASFMTNSVGEKVPSFIGPRVRRISPLDIVFNPIAGGFKDSFKIIRSLRNRGELAAMAEEEPQNAYLAKALVQRKALMAHASVYGIQENAKDEGFQVDGFGNYHEYLQSDYVEFLEFYGDLYDAESGVLEKGMHVVIVDRMWTIKKKPIDSWFGSPPIYHVGWRLRSDNLWAMGPLENLIGMQYRIDHLENLKADAMDLAVLPPLKIKGEVEQFVYGPGEEIHLDENGDVEELAKNTQWVIVAETNIDRLEMRMEQYAGAPREAMGIRSPGEKTMFEVQQLQNAAGRIFQEKINTFELFLERVLNAMLEVAKRNLDREDIVRVIDDDHGVTQFLSITKEDITASGKIRPIGARHFGAKAQLMQNLTQLSNTPVWAQISPHVSGKRLALLVEDVMDLASYTLVSPNVAVWEQQETAKLANQAGEDMLTQQAVPDPE
jgi:hypothetical protein